MSTESFVYVLETNQSLRISHHKDEHNIDDKWTVISDSEGNRIYYANKQIENELNSNMNDIMNKVKINNNNWICVDGKSPTPKIKLGIHKEEFPSDDEEEDEVEDDDISLSDMEN